MIRAITQFKDIFFGAARIVYNMCMHGVFNQIVFRKKPDCDDDDDADGDDDGGGGDDDGDGGGGGGM